MSIPRSPKSAPTCHGSPLISTSLPGPVCARTTGYPVARFSPSARDTSSIALPTRSASALGAFYRRMRAKLGAPKAITAAAHKLARIIYHLLTTRTPYCETVLAAHDIEYKRRFESRLRRQAHSLG